MVNLPKLDNNHSVSLAELPEEYDKNMFLKQGIFCIESDGKPYLTVPAKNKIQALTFLSHFQLNLPLIELEEDLYEDFYTQSLDIKKESEEDTDLTEPEQEDEGHLLDILKTSEDLLKSEESAPIIQFVNRVFYQAVKRNASDVHVEPGREGCEVRFRIDGVLQKYIELPKHAISGVINRIKVISHLDISEKRLPQDGRTQITIANKSLDIRVSSLPSHFGERIVMRILMQSQSIPTMDQLGFSMPISDSLKEIIKNPHGIILVTGPTGSGKSTSIYSMLQMIKTPEINIMTIEDPIEYNLDGISQTQVNTKSGLTFAKGLRSILRQDPDVILIGEMRDTETSQIAIQSSLTGHLVFSTLHTNDAASSITRLVDMGVERFLISSTLLAVLAQRLVRILCPECKKLAQIDSFSAKLLDVKETMQVFEPVGCPSCNHTGFKGRRSVGELLLIDSTIKEIIQEGGNDQKIKQYALNKGMKTLKDNAIVLLEAGETTVNEIIKVSLDK